MDSIKIDLDNFNPEDLVIEESERTDDKFPYNISNVIVSCSICNRKFRLSDISEYFVDGTTYYICWECKYKIVVEYLKNKFGGE